MNLSTNTMAFIGGGNMAEALLRGLIANKVMLPRQLIVTDVLPARLDFLHKAYGVRTTQDNATAAKEADIILLAVKPQQMTGVLTSLLDAVTSHKLIISIAAGTPTSRIEKGLGGNARVVRVMPNTPALVGAGAAALAAGKLASPDDVKTTETILRAVGITVTVEEALLDAVTGLSGSGPAYVFLVAEAMIQAGIEQGLSPEISKKLAIHTIFGAAVLLAEGVDTPAELRRKVTSPGGTTEAAIKVMTERELVKTFSEAIAAATRRGKELAGS